MAKTPVKRPGVVGRLRKVSWLRAVTLSPVVARPGYWLVTLCAIIWGGVLSGFRLRREAGLIVAPHLPRWAYGRGGTTVGGVYLTTDNVSPRILEHEAVHRDQWKRYGLAFVALYVDAGQDARTNRFEIEAGLKKGGYLR